MFAPSEIREVGTLARNQEAAFVVTDANFVGSPADYDREKLAGAFVCHPDGAIAEKAKAPGLNTLFKMEGESGSKRHRGEPLL